MGGNRCDVITITEADAAAADKSKRKGVLFSARIHPGESNSSFVMKGIMEYLALDESPEAQALRRNFVFKIVPMINVDGVKQGNYRCSLSGIDLNRTWKQMQPNLFPEIAAIKQLAEQFHQQHPVVCFVDLHGHSRAKRAFMYGNNYHHNPESTRLLPYIYSKVMPEIFSFEKSKFSLSKGKEGTSRVALWKLLKVPAVYTLETSLCGAGKKSSMPHFTPGNLMLIGKKLCLTLLVYQGIKVGDESESVGLSTLQREQLAQELIDNVTSNLPKSQKEANDSMSECSGGSDSDPGEDTLPSNDFAEVLPDKLVKQLRMTGLHESTKAQSTFAIPQV